jgi:hypothetical protein
MKTPREILLARHQAVVPKLDRIRHAVVGEWPEREPGRQRGFKVLMASLPGLPHKLWRELVLPCRRIWLGFAAVWLLLFVINAAQQDSSQDAVVQRPPSAGLMMAYRDQQRMLDELLAETPAPRPVVENRQQNAISKPRSEIIETINI